MFTFTDTTNKGSFFLQVTPQKQGFFSSSDTTNAGLFLNFSDTTNAEIFFLPVTPQAQGYFFFVTPPMQKHVENLLALKVT